MTELKSHAALYSFIGGSLDRYGKIPEPVLGLIAAAVIKGLQYLWSLKIMHRGMLNYPVGIGGKIVPDRFLIFQIEFQILIE